MRRILFILLTPIILFLILIASLDLYIIPKALEFAQKELTSYSEKNLPVIIRTGHIEISYLKPAIQIENVEIISKGPLLPLFKQVTIKKVEAQIDRFGLLTGSLGFSSVLLSEPQTTLELDPLLEKDSKPEPIPVDEIFALFEKIPIQNLSVEKSLIKVNSEKNKLSVDTHNTNFSIANRPHSISLRIDGQEIQMKANQLASPLIEIKSLVKLYKKSIDVNLLQLQSQGLTFRLSGVLLDWQFLTLHPQGKFQIDSQFKLSDLQQFLQALNQETKIPTLDGKFKLSSTVQFENAQHINGSFELETQDIKLSEYEVGDSRASGSFNQKHLLFKEILLSHSAGEGQLLNSELFFNKEFEFHTDVHVKKFDLQKLFLTLNLKSIPVDLLLSGQLPCKGSIRPFVVNCTGEVSGQDLLVKSEKTDQGSTIVALTRLDANGGLSINTDKIEYKAKLKLEDSLGESSGVIQFKQGFDISFKSPALDFKNIKNLANLKFTGTTTVNGFTKGNSSAGIVQMNLGSHNFVFENYQLGDMATLLKYEKSHLTLNEIKGELSQSQYQGQIDLNLAQSKISGNLDFPKADLNDVAKIFEQIYKFPLTTQGSGKIQAQFDGPLDFWKLNYKLNSQFRAGAIQGDSFDQFNFNVSANKGSIHADQVSLQKNASVLILNGGITEKQELKLSAEAMNWRLEESEFINHIKNGVSGAVQLRCELNGTVTEPDIQVRGNLTDIIVDEQEIPSSHFNFKINKKKFEANANLFGNKIQGDLIMPMQKNSAPLSLKLKTIDWNFTTLLALIGASSLQKEYDSSLTSDVDIHSDNGDFENASGKIIAKNVFLQRDYLSLQNTDPIQILIDKGNINLKNFKLSGPQNSLELKGDQFRLSNLNLNIVADTELRLLHMFAPFLEDLGGPIQMSATVTGNYLKPQLLGTANIENAFAKIKGFPHPVEKLKTDVVFSHSKIIIQNIHGQMAGGEFTGDGTILINALGDIPTNIRAHATGLNLIVPDKVRTSGSADLIFSGHWFPFILSGNYYVTNAMIEKEFGDDSSTLSDVKQSVYLPKILKQANFDPVLLDLQVHLDHNIFIHNSLIEGSLSGNLQVKGPPQSPILLGKINLEKGTKLSFRDKKFEVQNGFANFTNPNEINPDIYVSSQSRINNYDINLIVQGASKNPVIRMSSVPPLPEQDIVSLLALGVTSAKLEEAGQSKDQASQLALEAAGSVALAQTGLNRGLSNNFGVNLQLASSYDSTKNVSAPKVTISKQISNKLTISASASQTSYQTSQEVKLNYLINQNYSAVGSWENRESQSNSSLTGTQNDSKSIFGLDLEFKREFR